MVSIFDREGIRIQVWSEMPQVELFTTRGKSYIVQGAEARVFAQWLEDHLVNPILKNAILTTTEAQLAHAALEHRLETSVHANNCTIRKVDGQCNCGEVIFRQQIIALMTKIQESA